MDKRRQLEDAIDAELKKLTVYGNKELCFEIHDKEQREAIKRAALLVKQYEKLAK